MSQKHLDYVRQHPCFKCGSEPVEAHHLIAERHSQRKRDDHFSIPLCPRCHRQLHDREGDEKKFLGNRGFKAAYFFAASSPCPDARLRSQELVELFLND